MIEIHSLLEFDTHLESGRTLSGVVLQGLNLSDRTNKLRSGDLTDALFLGCDLDTSIVCDMISRGAILFPKLSGIPFNAYRNRLYAAEELLGSVESPLPYPETLDGRIYQHYLAEGGANAAHIKETLARRLHDHAMTDARNEFIAGQKVVAIMGGHSLRRDDPGYLEVAEMAADLAARGFLLTSGGGPGAMEATHLGAWFSD